MILEEPYLLVSWDFSSYFLVDTNNYYKKILRQLISSHFQTGATVVIGNDVKKITCVCDIYTFFL